MDTNSFDKKYISRLATKYLSGTATEEEQQILHNWYNNAADSEPEVIITAQEKTAAQYGEEAFVELKKRIAADKNNNATIYRKRYAPWTYAAAALILFMAGAGVYYLTTPLTQPEKPPVVQAQVPAKTIAAPTGSKPVLTLANGSQILLNEVNKGIVATQGNASVEKSADGRIYYRSTAAATENLYNTLTVPRGSNTASVMLGDGTVAWLNVASSITYPTAFTGNERKVTISGEVYFEVAKDASKPFIVEKQNGGARIQVLGTHFNVNAYNDEQDIKVTLLEGLVKVSTQNAAAVAIIKPGQQASISNTIKVTAVNTAEAVAWKDGFFKFNKTDIQTIMRQAARWYDVDISYKNEAPSDKFSGALSRSVNLESFLQILEYSEVKTKVEGKTIFVNP